MDNMTLPDTRTRSPGWRFWLSWVGASTAAILLVFGIMYALIGLAKVVRPGINEDRVFDGLMFPILATVLGALQWFVLRRRLPKPGWWVLATGVGMLVGIALGRGVVQPINHILGGQWDSDLQPGILVLYVLIGLSLALAQLPILWRHFTGSALWLLASVAGWLALGLIVGKSIDRTSDIVAFGAVPAAFTGLGLIWLMQSRRSQPPRPA